MSKAQTIREALKANPTLSPKEIADKLGDGITGQYVSLIRYQDKKSAGKKTAKRKAKKSKTESVTLSARKVSAKEVGIDENSGLFTACQFVNQCGGFDKARAAIAYLESIQIGG